MLGNSQSERIARKILILQVISAGILIGAVLFAAVIASIVDWKDVSTKVPLMTLIGAGTGVSLYFLSFVIPRVSAATMVQATAQQLSRKNQAVDDEHAIDGIVQQLTANQIVFAALVEGAILLNMVVFMLDKSMVSLVIVGVGLAVLLIGFPFKSRVLGQLEDQMELIRSEMRHFG